MKIVTGTVDDIHKPHQAEQDEENDPEPPGQQEDCSKAWTSVPLYGDNVLRGIHTILTSGSSSSPSSSSPSSPSLPCHIAS